MGGLEDGGYRGAAEQKLIHSPVIKYIFEVKVSINKGVEEFRRGTKVLFDGFSRVIKDEFVSGGGFMSDTFDSVDTLDELLAVEDEKSGVEAGKSGSDKGGDYIPRLETVRVVVRQNSLLINSNVFLLPCSVRSAAVLRGIAVSVAGKLRDDEDSVLLALSSGHLVMVKLVFSEGFYQPFVAMWHKVAEPSAEAVTEQLGYNIACHASGEYFVVNALCNYMSVFRCQSRGQGPCFSRCQSFKVEGTILQCHFFADDSQGRNGYSVFALVMTGEHRLQARSFDWVKDGKDGKSETVARSVLPLYNTYGVPCLVAPLQSRQSMLVVFETQMVAVSLYQIHSGGCGFAQQPYSGAFPVSWHVPRTRMDPTSSKSEVLVASSDGTVYLVGVDDAVTIQPFVKVANCLSLFSIERTDNGMFVFSFGDDKNDGYTSKVSLCAGRFRPVETLDKYCNWCPVNDYQTLGVSKTKLSHSSQELWLCSGEDPNGRIVRLRYGLTASVHGEIHKGFKKATAVFAIHFSAGAKKHNYHLVANYPLQTKLFTMVDNEFIQAPVSPLKLSSPTVLIKQLDHYIVQVTENSICVCNMSQVFYLIQESHILMADVMDNYVAYICQEQNQYIFKCKLLPKLQDDLPIDLPNGLQDDLQNDLPNGLSNDLQNDKLNALPNDKLNALPKLQDDKINALPKLQDDKLNALPNVKPNALQNVIPTKLTFFQFKSHIYLAIGTMFGNIQIYKHDSSNGRFSFLQQLHLDVFSESAVHDLLFTAYSIKQDHFGTAIHNDDKLWIHATDLYGSMLSAELYSNNTRFVPLLDSANLLHFSSLPITLRLSANKLHIYLLSRHVWRLSVSSPHCPPENVFFDHGDKVCFDLFSLPLDTNENNTAFLREDGLVMARVSELPGACPRSYPLGFTPRKSVHVSYLHMFCILTAEAKLGFFDTKSCTKAKCLESPKPGKARIFSSGEKLLAISEWAIRKSPKSSVYKNIVVGCQHGPSEGLVHIVDLKKDKSDRSIVKVGDLYTWRTDGPVFALQQLQGHNTLIYSSGNALYTRKYSSERKTIEPAKKQHVCGSLVVSIVVKSKNSIIVSTKASSAMVFRFKNDVLIPVCQDSVSRYLVNAVGFDKSFIVVSEKLHLTISGMKAEGLKLVPVFKHHTGLVGRLQTCSFYPMWFNNVENLKNNRFILCGVSGDITLFVLLTHEQTNLLNSSKIDESPSYKGLGGMGLWSFANLGKMNIDSLNSLVYSIDFSNLFFLKQVKDLGLSFTL